MTTREILWARFDEHHVEIGIAERGEQPADTDIQFDVTMLVGYPARNLHSAIVTAVGEWLAEHIDTAVAQGAYPASDDEVPF